MKLHRRDYEQKQRMMAYNLFRRREADHRRTRIKAIASYFFLLGATIAAIITMIGIIINNGGRP